MRGPPLVLCPGCGGRNRRGAPVCDWCGRPFISPGRQVSARWVHFGLSLLFATVVAVVVLLGILNAQRPEGGALPAPTPSPAPTFATAFLTPTPRSGAVAQGQREAPASPSPTARPTPSATPQPLKTARIANTQGRGANLRRQPSAAAALVTALREGTQVTVLDQLEVTAARIWRLVRDPRGTEGWVLADLLEFESE